jgi:hypothetical protein
MPQEMGKVFTL